MITLICDVQECLPETVSWLFVDHSLMRTQLLQLMLCWTRLSKTAGDQQHELVIRESEDDQDESSSMPGAQW